MLFKSFYSCAPNRLLYKININQHKNGLFSYRTQYFFFMHIPKSAGTSVYSALNLGDPGHITYRNACSIDENIGDKKIAFVFRNPTDRLFSSYNYAYCNVKEKPFSMLQKIGRFSSYFDFLKWLDQSKLHDKHYFFFPVTEYIKYADINKLIIISFDHLNEGVSEFAKLFNLPCKYLPKLNISKKHNIRSTKEKLLERLLIDKFYNKDQMLYDEIKKQPLTIGANLNIAKNHKV